MPVLNAGFGQDGTEHLLWRLKSYDWQRQSPREVLLLIGTNDIGYPTCDIVWGILTAVKTVRHFPEGACHGGQHPAAWHQSDGRG